MNTQVGLRGLKGALEEILENNQCNSDGRLTSTDDTNQINFIRSINRQKSIDSTSGEEPLSQGIKLSPNHLRHGFAEGEALIKDHNESIEYMKYDYSRNGRLKSISKSAL